MKRLRFLLLFITGMIITFSQSAAQEIDIDIEMDADVFLSDSIAEIWPESFDADLQKILESWHTSFFSTTEAHCMDGDVNPVFSDTIYRKRMNRMMTEIPMVYNEAVRQRIDRYAVRSRNSLRYLMGMSDYYFPMFEQILDAHNLPLELKYLAIVESALRPDALSRAGASGLWQFMLPTGKTMGLEINSLIDERLDPVKATEAACRYLKYLYDMYDDWFLALAAYNWGHGNVNRAIARSGGKMDYWQLVNYLPRETRWYVPTFIATAYIMTYHCEHNICPVRASFPIATDTIMVERALHFDQIADILKIDKELVRFYNPHYKREIIPGHIQPSVLRLPIDDIFAFINQEDSVYLHRMEELLANCAPVDPNAPVSRQQRITHTVKAGETVYTIANLYGVTAQNLRRWNAVTGSRLATGSRLTVHVDNGGIAHATPATSTAASSTTASTQARPASETASQTANSHAGYITYRVISGDTLSAIARKYPGVTVQSIQQANGLNSTNLRIGQILRIPQG